MPSAAYPILRELAVGDVVPPELYVLDAKDGTRPRWTVERVEELPVTAGRVLVVIDPDNGTDNHFGVRIRVALRIITHPNKTLRSQPYQLGGDPPPMLCDLDQQGRHVEKVGAR